MPKTKPTTDPAVSAAAKALGAKGGKNGRGAAKRRTPEQYDALAEARRKALVVKKLKGKKA